MALRKCEVVDAAWFVAVRGGRNSVDLYKNHGHVRGGHTSVKRFENHGYARASCGLHGLSGNDSVLPSEKPRHLNASSGEGRCVRCARRMHTTRPCACSGPVCAHDPCMSDAAVGMVSTIEQASQLLFCSVMFKETLRLHPPAASLPFHSKVRCGRVDRSFCSLF